MKYVLIGLIGFILYRLCRYLCIRCKKTIRDKGVGVKIDKAVKSFTHFHERLPQMHAPAAFVCVVMVMTSVSVVYIAESLA